ncbi:unnamed protein product [Kuraishia capsulata CBS 1993]|uniref:Polynucleotide 5'-hydroxyl-kinase GRC3 n=1 Tax=Kuraishia capsulata CBS 1993 TaxID=1382522 RepID=W6MUK6_9ASCO|nr:uncharacterized protein KUCA_T00001680001 [Kuraishia capsulata CBS 1993]CDK25710.1 unnamed protein product [Kuraishia capsulata CBS 1993]
MSIPGLQGIISADTLAPHIDTSSALVPSGSATALPNAKTVEISAFSEWRFELGSSSDKLRVRLVAGEAEMFGTELSSNMEYSFTGAMKTCIFTFKGCTIEYAGCELSSEYVSDESCMTNYLNLHFALERLRKEASTYNETSTDKRLGPKVLIVGNKDSGKTSLAKILTAYATKMDRQPILVNLDPSTANFSIPGMLTGTTISDIMNVENVNLGETITTGPTFYHQKQPIVKCFGLESFSDNDKLYKYEISQLGISVLSRLRNDQVVGESGLVVDTPAFKITDYELIENIISDFEIDVLIVIGHERLFVDLKKKLIKPSNQNRLTVLKMPKSSGCVDLDDKFSRDLQQRCIREYFYGIEKQVLSPFSIMANLKDLIIFKPVEPNGMFGSSGLSFLSGDMEEDEDIKTEPNAQLKFTEYSKLLERITEPTAEILSNAVLAMVNPSGLDLNRFAYTDDEQALIEDTVNTSVVGFTYAVSVDDTKGKARFVVPSPANQMPSKVLILTKFRYHE